MKRGFTLIEVLVVIAIVSLLIAITLPALGSARTTARQTLSLTNVRSIGQTFSMYVDTHGTYPFPGQVEDVDVPGGELIYSFEWFPRGAIVATSSIWQFGTLWPALVSNITPWEEAYSTWVSPGRDKSLPTLEDIFLPSKETNNGWPELPIHTSPDKSAVADAGLVLGLRSR